MRNLGAERIDTMNRAVVELYAQPDPEGVKRTYLALINSLIGMDVGTVDEVQPDGSVRLTTYPGHELERVDQASRLLPHFLHEHPGMPAFYRRDPEPVRLTDQVQFSKYLVTGLYNEVYRPFGVLYQMNSMPPGEDLRNAAITLHRQTSDFSEEDGIVLYLLAPHFAQAHANALRLASLHRERELLDKAFRVQRQEAIFLSEGRATSITAQAASWLEGYFPGQTRRGGLPEALFDWVQARRRAQQTNALTSSQEPLKVSNHSGRLEAQWWCDAGGRQMVLLREQQSIFAVERLASLGLTRRESEVFRWIVEGKTDQEIGIILGMSEHTAHKHAQHILQKLGVSSRATVLLRVCELLGAL
jgi:DNA-binding CsgD family transcriptional regulator/GAF domain-containing protein